MTSRNSVDLLATAHSAPASRAPARPATATAMLRRNSTSSGVLRPCRTVRPGTCSANVRRPHDRSSQNRRRTCSTMVASRPPHRGVGQPAPVSAMGPGRGRTAARAGHRHRPRPRPDPHPTSRLLDPLDLNPGQMGQQHPKIMISPRDTCSSAPNGLRGSTAQHT